MAQAKTIQLLRSSKLYVPTGSGSEAKTALENAKDALTGLTGRKDGEIVLARYQEANAGIKSVLGIYHTTPNLPGGSAPGWTFIQDVTSSVEGLDALQREVDAVETGAGLNENGTYKQTEDEKALEIIGVQGQAADSLMSAIEKIAHAVGDADSSLATNTSKVVTGYTQVNAKITQADTTDVVNLTLTGYTEGADSSGKIVATDTLGSALGKLQGQINGMDLTAVTAEGEVITSVSQTDGKVSASKTPIKDVKLTGYVKGSETGDIAATDDVEGALSKLENRIAKNTVSSTDKTININTTGATTDLSVNIDTTTLVKDSSTGVISSALKVIKVIPSGTAGTDEVVDANLSNNVKEAYRLVYDGSTTAIGKQIDIYKDSSLLSVKLLHATDSLKPTYTNGTWTDIDSGSQTEENLALCFAYQLADGTTSVEAVAVGDFLRESEFKDGLVVNSTGEVRVLVDQNSESVITEYGATAAQNVTAPVLSVSSDGVKVSNIQNAIDAAVAHASADLAVTAQGDNYITAAQDATNNKKINVSADVQDLTATAGTPGVYNATTGEQTTAPVAGTLSGVANSLGDAADIATKVKTYVDGAIAIEAARSDAKNLADLKTVVEGLDGTATASSATNVDSTPTADFKVLTKVAEVDGKVVETTGANGSTAVTLKKLAATGAAADVSIADGGGLITETTVEGALQEIATNVRNNALVSNDVIVVTPDTANNNTKLSVTTGNGLEKTGTNNNTLSVKEGDGITVDANGVAVDTGLGLEINSTSKAVDIKIDPTSAKLGDGTDGMLTVSANGLKLNDTWDCGVF